MRRAAGYNSWASFIGRVIYAKAPIGGNYSSLAGATGATLWDPNSLNGQFGEGRLWIVPERPILLFRNKLKTSGDFLGTVCLLDTVNTWAASATTPPTNIYKDYWQPGEYIADKEGKVFFINSADAGHTTWTLTQVTQLTNGEYLWLERLRWTGGTIVEYDDSNAKSVYKLTVSGNTYSWNRSWDLHQAQVLKNTTTKTYISPWAEGAVNSRMALELQSPGRVSFPNTGNSTTKVHILGWNDVTYCIDHSALVNGMPSLVDPWTYEIKSFFRTSDPNPFASYEAPYLRLQASGADLATTLGSDRKWQKLLSRGRVSGAAYDHSAWPLDGEFSNGTMPYLEQHWEREPELGTRRWHLRASYPLLSGGHWMAYQWKLYDAN